MQENLFAQLFFFTFLIKKYFLESYLEKQSQLLTKTAKIILQIFFIFKIKKSFSANIKH